MLYKATSHYQDVIIPGLKQDYPQLIGVVMPRRRNKRKNQIVALLARYNKPVSLNEFVRTHISEFDLEDNYKGRNVLSVYINRMVSRAEILKTRVKGVPSIYLAPTELETGKQDRATQKKSGKPRYTAKQEQLLKVLARYDEPVHFSHFVSKHIMELGWPNDRRGKQNATAYVNRLISLGLIKKEKRGRFAYIILPDTIRTRYHSKIQRDSPRKPLPGLLVTKKKTAGKPSDISLESLPGNFEALNMAKIKIDAELEQLDQEIEHIVEERKKLRQQRTVLEFKIQQISGMPTLQ